MGVAMNVAAADTIDAAFTRVHEQLGRYPDILVNCAGVALLKPFLEQTSEELDTVIGTNLRGAFLVGQRAARAVADKGGGSIINVARSEEHTSELQSLMRISYAVFCWKQKHQYHTHS